jgi:hypothetical protein
MGGSLASFPRRAVTLLKETDIFKSVCFNYFNSDIWKNILGKFKREAIFNCTILNRILIMEVKCLFIYSFAKLIMCEDDNISVQNCAVNKYFIKANT